MTRTAFALVATISVATISVAARAREASAQTIARRVDAVRDGVVLMTFAARPGVCGNSNGSIWTRDTWRGMGSMDYSRGCEPGPIRVSLGRADGATISARVYVGGAWRANASETDLGVVPPSEAAQYMIMVAHAIGGRSGNDAVSAAALADAEVGPELVSLVRDANAPLDARKQALYWAGQTTTPTRDLAQLYERLDVFALREHFIFVISQRRDDLAVDKLIDVARHDSDIEIRKRAMYWLGQTNDPRALRFLRDLVTR